MDSRPNDETLLRAVAERDMGAFRGPGIPVPALRQVS